MEIEFQRIYCLQTCSLHDFSSREHHVLPEEGCAALALAHFFPGNDIFMGGTRVHLAALSPPVLVVKRVLLKPMHCHLPHCWPVNVLLGQTSAKLWVTQTLVY